MMPGSWRERSGSELVFGVLKALMVGYHLWGSSSGLDRTHLSDALHTKDPELNDVLDYLATEGLVAIDSATDTVRLTDHGARDLLVNWGS